MKKIIITLIVVILVGLGIYYSQRNQKNSEKQNSTGSMDEMTSPVPASPSPVPTAPSPTPAHPQSPTPTPSPKPPASQTKTFRVTDHNFAFSQSEIRVKKGDTVTINFESTEGFHNLTIDGYNVATNLVSPGTKTSVVFTASNTGTFEYYCSVGSHRQMGMVGTLIVE